MDRHAGIKGTRITKDSGIHKESTSMSQTEFSLDSTPDFDSVSLSESESGKEKLTRSNTHVEKHTEWTRATGSDLTVLIRGDKT